MATIVDSLVVSLGLDASGFKKGQKEAEGSLKKLRDDAVKHGKEIEKSAKDSGESFHNLTREIATFVATIASAKAVYDFLKALNQINAATGRVAQSLGSSPEAVSAFGQAVERFGGNANEAAGSLQRLLDQFNELRTTGQSAILPWLAQLQSRGGVRVDVTKPITQQLFAVAEDLKNIAARDPGLAMFLGRKLGLDEGTIRLLMQGSRALADTLGQTRNLAITREQADASIRVQKAWAEMLQSIEAAGRQLLVVITPGLERMIKLIEWFADGWRHFFNWLVMIKREWSDWTRSVWQGTKDALANIVSTISGAGGAILDAFKKAFWSAFDWLKNEFNAIWKKVTGSNLFDMSAQAAEAPGGGTGPLAGGAAEGASPGGAPGSGRAAGGGAQQGDDRPIIGGRVRHAKGNLANNQAEAYAAARAEGLSDTASRALVANMTGESLANPRDYHWDRKHMSQGIVQWDPQRAEAIKQRFGKYPKDMSVAEQTRAAIWEINNNRRFARTAQALRGSNADQMIRALVENYEAPLDTRGGIAARYGFYRGLPAQFGAGASAGINNSRSSSVVNNQSSQAVFNGGININAPGADGHGIARDLQKVIDNHSFAAHMNYGIN